MKKSSRLGLLAALAGLFIASVVLAPKSWAASQAIRRYAANFLLMDDGEFSTTSAPSSGGITIYDKLVKVPADVNVMYITIEATGDTHSDAGTALRCEVDGVPCNKGAPFSSGAPGWIVLQRHDLDLHDNNINYTWCIPGNKFPSESGFPVPGLLGFPGGFVRTVKLKMASTNGGDVFIEQMHVFVDGSHIFDTSNACTEKSAPVD